MSGASGHFQRAKHDGQARQAARRRQWCVWVLIAKAPEVLEVLDAEPRSGPEPWHAGAVHKPGHVGRVGSLPACQAAHRREWCVWVLIAKAADALEVLEAEPRSTAESWRAGGFHKKGMSGASAHFQRAKRDAQGCQAARCREWCVWVLIAKAPGVLEVPQAEPRSTPEPWHAGAFHKSGHVGRVSSLS